MGIYDREYYRDENRARGGTFLSQTTMITKIVVVTGAVFVLDMLIGGRSHWLMAELASGPQDLQEPWYWWRFLTSGFAHDPTSINHILLNMASLWFLGRDVEAVYGSRETLRFYLVAIVLGSVSQALREYLFVPPEYWARCWGASGAVTAVIMLFVCHFPRQTLLLFLVIPVPAWLAGILVIGINVFGFSGMELPIGNEQARVAYDVHLVGAVFALCYFWFGWNLGRLMPDALTRGKWFQATPRLRVHEPDDDRTDKDAAADELLEKVNQHGIDSLTARERQLLEDYSRRMRQKHR